MFWICALSILLASVAAQRGGSGGRPTSGDRDGFVTNAQSFPPFFRVEAEIIRLENPKGMRSDGKDCDTFGAGDCDPRVSAYLDVNSALAPWPGGKPVKEWPAIFEAANVNSPTITRTVNRDICGGSISRATLRVLVEDVDPGVSNDEIGKFECQFNINPRDISRDARSAQWDREIECNNPGTQKIIKLFARLRAFEISSSSCQATADSGSVGGAGAGAKREGENDFIRIDAELVQLINPQGVTHKKEACDSGNACDPAIRAYLDIDKPLAQWPGTKTVDQYTNIFSINNENSPVINKNISRNVCGGAVSQVNLRVRVEDADVTSSDLIEDFECVFVVNYRRVARELSLADWSSTEDCKPLRTGHDIRLQYRYRVYDIRPQDCGVKPQTPSAPPRSG